MNAIHEEGGETIKETSEENSDKVADVSSDATVVEIINKAAESNLIKALVEASAEGESTDKVLAEADAPVVLDASAIVPLKETETTEEWLKSWSV